jgi:hypothetical protein
VEELFAWYNLIFFLPIIISIALVFGAGFGVDGDIDDADVDADIDAETPVFLKALSIIGIGRCPLSIVILSALLIFGGSGIVLNQFFAPWLPIASVGGAFFSMLFFTRIVATLIGKIMPGTETYVVSKDHLVGVAGKLVMNTSTDFGMAHVRDHHGGLHKIQCKTYKGELASGTDILVVDRKEDVFYVEKDPQT